MMAVLPVALVLAAAVAAAATSSVAAAGTTDRPIVGILTQPTGSSLSSLGDSYVAASYVKFVEAGGCRAVPVFHNSTEAELDAVFASVNGLLFPGGGANLIGTPLRRSAEYLLKKAIAASAAGDHFPVFGHCMGFELLAYIISGENDILEPTDAEDIPLHLNLTHDGEGKGSSVWFGRSMTEDTRQTISTEAVTMNNHHWGVYPSRFAKTPALNKFFRVLSTNRDRKGVEFISTWEGIDHPIYGMQWHAEKNQFEWNPTEAIPHSTSGVRAMNYFSSFLGAQARMNNHKYPTPADAAKAVFYNYPAYYTESLVADFEQCYVW